MRFALPTYKFEGLQLGHQFLFDLMSLLEALSLNVAKEKVKKKLRERSGKPLLQRTSRSFTNRFPNQWRTWFSQRELTLIIDGFVTDLYSFFPPR